MFYGFKINSQVLKISLILQDFTSFFDDNLIRNKCKYKADV